MYVKLIWFIKKNYIESIINIDMSLHHSCYNDYKIQNNLVLNELNQMKLHDKMNVTRIKK